MSLLGSRWGHLLLGCGIWVSKNTAAERKGVKKTSGREPEVRTQTPRDRLRPNRDQTFGHFQMDSGIELSRLMPIISAVCGS